MPTPLLQKSPTGHYQFCGIHFIQSAAQLDQLPPDTGLEVAFIGRSNSGKSSALNTLSGTQALARVGNTPGKTRLMNLFAIDPEQKQRIMDLPGYGYAQVSQSERHNWLDRFQAYIQERRSLQGLFLIMDARHPYQKNDQEHIAQLIGEQIKVCILLNKVDKLSKREIQTLKSQLQKKAFSKFHQIFPEILFSAQTGYGLAEAQHQLFQWLHIPPPV